MDKKIRVGLFLVFFVFAVYTFIYGLTYDNISGSAKKDIFKSSAPTSVDLLMDKNAVFLEDYDAEQSVLREIVGPDVKFSKKITEKTAAASVKDFLNQNKVEFKIDIRDLQVKKIVTRGDKTFVYFDQTYKGIPIYESRTVAYIKGDELMYLRSNYASDIKVNTKPKISKNLAKDNAKDMLTSIGYYNLAGDYFNYEIDNPVNPSATTTVIYPKKGNYYLAYKVDFEHSSLPSSFTFFVDAETGSVIDYIDHTISFDVSGTVTGMKWGDPYTDHVQNEEPFEDLYVEIDGSQYITDEDGFYSGVDNNGDIDLHALLSGPRVIVSHDGAEEAEHFFNAQRDLTHNWNWAEEDESTSMEESNVFYHINQIYDYAQSIGAVEVREDPIDVIVNGYGVCNAGFSHSNWQIVLGSYGTTCGEFCYQCDSMGLISDVLYHEYGHGINREVSDGMGAYWGQSGNLNEGLADYWACTMNNDPNMGEGFYYNNPSGLRNCNSDNIYPDDYDPEPHSGTEIMSGALWDVRSNLGKASFDPLIINALRLQPRAYDEMLEALVIMDDDNGNLGDGTPNQELICSAFVDHRIYHPICYGHVDAMAYIGSYQEASYPLVVMTGDEIDILGTVVGNELSSYTLYYGIGSNPSTWTQIASGSSNIQNGIIATDFDTSSLPLMDNYLKLEYQTTSGETRDFIRKLWIYNSNGYGYWLLETEFDCMGNNPTGELIPIMIGPLDGVGLYFNSMNGGLIKNCVISGFDKGIMITSSDGFTIENNILDQNLVTGIHLSGTDNSVIRSNTIMNHPTNGITLSYAEGNLIEDNTLISNYVEVSFSTSSHGNTLSQNEISNAYIGVNIASDGNEVVGNNVHGFSGSGIYISANNNVATENTITNSKFGFGLTGANNNVFESNIIENNFERGVSIRASDGSVLNSNTISNNGQLGVLVWQAEDTVLDGNIIAGNYNGISVVANTDNTQVNNNQICDNDNMDYMGSSTNSYTVTGTNNNFDTASGYNIWPIYGIHYLYCDEEWDLVECTIGDIDNDGDIDLEDLSLIVNAAIGDIELDEIGECAADVFDDGNIDVTDAVYLVPTLLELGFDQNDIQDRMMLT